MFKNVLPKIRPSKNFHGLHDDLKITRKKKLTPDRYPVQKVCPPKNGVVANRFNFKKIGPN